MHPAQEIYAEGTYGADRAYRNLIDILLAYVSYVRLRSKLAPTTAPARNAKPIPQESLPPRTYVEDDQDVCAEINCNTTGRKRNYEKLIGTFLRKAWSIIFFPSPSIHFRLEAKHPTVKTCAQRTITEIDIDDMLDSKCSFIQVIAQMILHNQTISCIFCVCLCFWESGRMRQLTFGGTGSAVAIWSAESRAFKALLSKQRCRSWADN